MACATAVRVSNSLGANLPGVARRSARTAIAITVLTQGSLALALVLGRDVWGRVFTSDPEVRRVFAQLEFPEGTQPLAQHVSRPGQDTSSWLTALPLVVTS